MLVRLAACAEGELRRPDEGLFLSDGEFTREYPMRCQFVWPNQRWDVHNPAIKKCGMVFISGDQGQDKLRTSRG
jgi:hypothetical protein